MSGRALLLVGLALLAPESTLRGAEDPPPVWFLSPPLLEPALGEVVVEVEVDHPEVREVRFVVDGRQIGVRQEPPYRQPVTLEGGSGAHRFEAVVMSTEGELFRVARTTPAVRVDEQVDLGLRQLYVTLAGRSPAPPLAADEFTVLDAGRAQEIVTFEGGDAALTMALLLDASDSMSGGALRTALEGARGLLDGLRELDEVALVLFADGILYRGPYAEEPAELERVLASVEAAGGTALNDALYLALRQLEARQGRRVVVLLSDGLDIHSTLEASQVLWTLRRSGSVVYWIELRTVRSDDRVRSPWRTDDEHDRERAGLRALVAESGGRVVRIERLEQARAAFASILDELRSQVVLGYYPSLDRDDGAWHEVSVRVARPGIKARTRRGYVDD